MQRFISSFSVLAVAALFAIAVPSAAQDRDRDRGDRGDPEDGARSERAPAPEELEFRDGVATIADRATFKKLSYQGEVRRDKYLTDLEFVKFVLVNAGTSEAQLYFMNTKTHQGHPMFMREIGMRGGPGGRRGGGRRGGPGSTERREPRGGGEGGGGRILRGALTYRPLVRAPNGQPGLYTYDFQPNDAFPVALLKFTQDVLVNKATVLKGKLGYHPLRQSAERYERDKEEFKAAGISVYLDRDLSMDLAFLPLNVAETFGRLRLMKSGEIPSPRDVVLYTTLPNDLPRVAGMITAARQTPLSHVNLRAIQDKVPNAFIRGASDHRAIRPLVDKYVFYRVAADGFAIREASSAEVEAHFAELRPREKQVPHRDLTVTQIRPLDEIAFGDSSIYGVKTANLASMRKFGLPEGTVPDGFGIPFHFYDEFMKHNDLYERAASIVSSVELRKDKRRLESELARFKTLVREGKMPEGMTKALAELQTSFPRSTPIRCRSSTNNEDLPGFSGAGLYDSVTHRPAEGHLGKSVKEVFASLWNLRAVEEREFYRIDHLGTAMGVLVHASFQGEKANGVAVTGDILYQTQGNYYLNTQAGEDLVTNPEDRSIPEEILLGWWPDDGHEVVQFSSRTEGEERILGGEHLSLLRKCLAKVHGKFAKLYKVDRDAPRFAMEIEYKITRDGALRIKQARPWVFAGASRSP